LVIEIDGSSHDNKYEYDKRRDEYMQELGLKVIRISDTGVLQYLEIELRDLETKIKKIKQTTPPTLSAPLHRRGIA
jgi:very-short-patch-repair endonuclease